MSLVIRVALSLQETLSRLGTVQRYRVNRPAGALDNAASINTYVYLHLYANCTVGKLITNASSSGVRNAYWPKSIDINDNALSGPDYCKQ